jgi:hypothetical protein
LTTFSGVSALRLQVLLAPVKLVGVTLMRNSYVATFSEGEHLVTIECHKMLGHYDFLGVIGGEKPHQIHAVVASFDGVIAEIVIYLQECNAWVPPASLVWRDAQWLDSAAVASTRVAPEVLNQMHDLIERLNELLINGNE